MAKSDTWPGGVAMESLINMDSAGSYDSVSDDSLEYLSVEERACLMFLESTIESLEMEEDSGLSNDEPDPSSLAAEHDHLSMGQTSLEDVSKLQHDDSGRDRKSYLNCRVPTPLLLANGLASIQLKVTGATTHPSTPTAAIELKAPLVATQPSTPGAVTDLKPQKVITEPTVPEVVTDPKAPKIATVPKTSELSSDIKAPGLATITKVPVLSTEFKTSKTTPSLATSDLPTDDSVDNMPKGVSVDSKPAKCNTKVPSELDLKLIPPPSDFRDDELEEKSDPPVPAELRGPLTYNELEQLRRQVSMKRAAPASPGAQDAPPSKPCVDLPVSAQALPSPSDVLPTPIPEALEPKSRPAVAPKPKRLPSNIILKSHKLDSHPSPSPIDRSMIDPQKVRREALRKLGLLKTEDGDSGPVVSSKSRKSWASPPSHSLVTTQTKAPAKIPTPAPVPAITLTPVPAITLTPVPAPALTPALVPAPVSATIPAPPTTPAPVPAQFSDNAKTLPSPATLPSPPKHIPPPIGVKSATLERSGKGLSSYVASNASLRANQGPKVALSPGNLRNSRPRPASLGTGKDFVNVQGEASHPQPVHGESHNKLPRSHGISVLICPNSKSGEDRREALKKLGLLGD
ncbi:specifically androgen-regulated gene protein-like isoform X2 [Oncorhynchus keta]|uniref:specifically androgen-regulated gene protein-like isoform X2 n=1 Tax=Oncorhynchus keta TaxID=8018 RepID=UPI0015F82413|nr:specifically androgen-regulated gene protein-like isoform X2 [Oncorhynchus keta]